MTNDWERIRAEFVAALGEKTVLSDVPSIDRLYRRNVTALDRHVPLVLRPRTQEDVARIVVIANEQRIPLHPFSTGRNWGLGSKLPVTDGCVPVDLSALNRIVEVSDDFAYAIIEPGVTQAQLADHLNSQHPRLTMNFTGSFGYTSIVGNVLERGDGGHARVEDLLGARGIFGDGTPFQVGGFWDHVGRGRPSHHSRFRAGPDLCGLFCQSNFGIVTQLAFRLIPKPESRCIFFGTAPDEHLEKLVDAFARLGDQGVINRGSVNIGYANRFVQGAASMKGGTGDPPVPSGHWPDGTTRGPDGSKGNSSGAPGVPGGGSPPGTGQWPVPPAPSATCWNFYTLVMGAARVTEAVLTELQATIGPLCRSSGAWRVNPAEDPRVMLPEFLHPLAQPLMGVPDTESIKLIYRLTGTPLPSGLPEMDVDLTPFGMKSCIPVVPPRGRYARQVAEMVAAHAARFGLNVKMSLFGDGRVLITIHFRTDDSGQVQRAGACEAALWDSLVAAGFPPYRASIDQMARLAPLEPAFFDFVGRLKSALDPRHIISPGRYCRTE